MTTFLVLCAFGFAAVGFLLASQATAGVYCVGVGLLFGVLARIEQAGAHHAVVLTTLRALIQPPPEPATTATKTAQVATCGACGTEATTSEDRCPTCGVAYAAFN